MAHPHPIPDYASPRASLASPGLTHRGKTPRSGGFEDDGQHTRFQFNEFGLEVSGHLRLGWEGADGAGLPHARALAPSTHWIDRIFIHHKIDRPNTY